MTAVKQSDVLKAKIGNIDLIILGKDSFLPGEKMKMVKCMLKLERKLKRTLAKEEQA